jgi:hypothetical protein
MKFIGMFIIGLIVLGLLIFYFKSFSSVLLLEPLTNASYTGPMGNTVNTTTGPMGNTIITGKNYDNYNHFTGSSIPTIYYGPNGGTAKVIENNGNYLIIVTEPSGNIINYTSTEINSNSYKGPNGETAILSLDNGIYVIKVTGINGNTIIYSSVSPQTYNPDYVNNNGIYTGPLGNTAGAVTGPLGNTVGAVTGPLGNTVVATNVNNAPTSLPTADYSSVYPPAIPKHLIPSGDEDLYILKSQIVPPVCPMCPQPIIGTNGTEEKCPPCPACARCPEPSFECKKVPNYNVINNEYLPVPVLNSFASF